MVQSTNCIIILVPIPSLPKPPFLTVLTSCKHSCRFSPLRNTGYPKRKLTIHFGNRPPVKRQGKLPLTQNNITPLLHVQLQLSKQITFTEACMLLTFTNPSAPTFLHPSKCQSPEQNSYAVLSISTDGRRKASATSLREVGSFFPKSK